MVLPEGADGDLQAKQERIAARRARIKAKLREKKKGTYSSDDDLPDPADYDKAGRGVGICAGGGKLKSARKSGQSGRSGRRRSEKSGDGEYRDRAEKGKAAAGPVTPGGKILMVDDAELEAGLSIDEKERAHIARSNEMLQAMLLDAEQFITNVKVAAEYRERRRHDRQEENKKERLQKLEQEAKECEEMYHSVTESWFEEAKGLLPLELYGQIQEQKMSCDDILEKKQDLIDSLKSEIEGADASFEGELEMHQKDIMLMGDRIDDQIELMRMAFINELDILEAHTAKDREEMMESFSAEWEELIQEYNASEQAALDAMHAATIERFNRLTEAYMNSREETRRMKEVMEADMRTLQLQSEQLKIGVILNSEKLDYNLEILHRRDTENMIMKSEMKRLLLRLQDRFNSKVQSMLDTVGAGKRENERLISEIQRLQDLNKDAMRKVLHEVATSYRKYMELWEMEEEEARDKLARLLRVEKFIFENYLALEVGDVDLATLDDRPEEVQTFLERRKELYDKRLHVSTPPRIEHISKGFRQGDDSTGTGTGTGTDTTLTSEGTAGSKDKEGQRQSQAPSTKMDPATTSTAAKSQISQNAKTVSVASLLVEPTESLDFLPGPDPDPAIQRRLMKHITQVICDQTGFIIEDKLRRIMAPMLKTEKVLVHVDAVMQALGVTNLEEMQLLARYMLMESRVMRGVMSKMGTDLTPEPSSMRVSLTELPLDERQPIPTKEEILDKIALASKPQLDLESEDEPRNILVSASSSDITSSGSIVSIPKSAHRVLDRIQDEGGIPAAADFQFGDAPKYDRVTKVTEDIDPGVLTPVSDVSSPSLGSIIKGFHSDESLVKVLKRVEQGEAPGGGGVETQAVDPPMIDPLVSGRRPPLAEGEESISDDSTCKSCSICSCESVDGDPKRAVPGVKDSVDTTNATILSWPNKPSDELKTDDVKVLLPTYSDPCKEKSETDSGTGTPTEFQQMQTSDEAGAQSLSISISSLATTSAGSDEFLYIEPNDVLRALAAFCKEYNAKIKIEIPSEEELIEMRLARLTFPTDSDVSEYWNRFLALLDTTNMEIWEAILKAFGLYSKELCKRNKLIQEIENLYRENMELGYLLRKNYRGKCDGSNFQMFAQYGHPYCDC